MALIEGRIRNVYMQGWLSVDIHQVYNDFLATTPEQDLRELVPMLGRPVRKTQCSDRHAPWYDLFSCYILHSGVPNIMGPNLFVGYVYRGRRARCGEAPQEHPALRVLGS